VRLVRAAPALAASLADLQAVPGVLPDLAAPDLPACRFCDRCDRALPVCRTEVPLTRTLDAATGHRVACWAVD
jgi:oligopeptide/dipeptide ABC transporter ATP-binding protein